MKNFEPGQYIWQTKSGDHIVTVQHILGKGPDGRLYVKVEGSNAGVPFDECHKEPLVVSKKPRRSKRFF